jgi:hypothetical protein
VESLEPADRERTLRGNSTRKAAVRFAYHFGLKRGFLDGKEGYIFCHLLAEYEFWIWARTFEIEKNRKRGVALAK